MLRRTPGMTKISLVRSSTDNGLTWSGATTVAGGTTTGRDGMPGCTDFTPRRRRTRFCVYSRLQRAPAPCSPSSLS
ncbi:hypothetical protein B0H14DRAFT_1656807 [Mycena olivaceomarginata]|nr:hypothetical protein B0H14DRAFT_1656807 [Mycena olivaceomarginata]